MTPNTLIETLRKLGAYNVHADTGSPYETLAATETAAFLAGKSGIDGWILLETPWKWETPLIGFLSKPVTREYARRVTGGPVWVPARSVEPFYGALIGPRIGERPARLSVIAGMASWLADTVRLQGPLRVGCGCGSLHLCPGKILQRPLIELCGDRCCLEEILSMKGVRVRAGAALEPGDLLEESLKRLSSASWLDPVRTGNTVSKEYVSSNGFTLRLEANVREPPVIEWFRMCGDFYVYPPAQARLLMDQVSGSSASRLVAVELLNAWGTLVEQVGYPFGELRDAVVGFFGLLEDTIY